MILRKTLLAAALLGLVTAASAGAYTSPGGAIPDNLPGNPLLVTFNVIDVGPLASVDLTLTNLTHTWAGDLIVTLMAPNGTFADIMRRPTTAAAPTSTVGDSTNFGGTYRFIDGGADLGAALTIGSTAVVPGGDYGASSRIVGSTANFGVMLNTAFANTPLLGTWTLALSDNAGADFGALGSATLNVTAVPEASTLAMFGLGLAGIAALRRRKA
jgi:subtilisin-like proprotein convertase family protein